MNKFILFFVVAVISFNQVSAQQKVFTQDIDNFWIAYDSIKTTDDSLKQIKFIQTLYIDKGTQGLKTFMQLRNYSAGLYVHLINKYPKFWNSIRPNTLAVKSKGREIEKSVEKFKTLYPELKDAKMYFTIGGLRSGGTTKDSMVMVGAEIATGDSATDVSEFSDKWLAGVFKEQNSENIVSMNVHEYVHTQQNGEGNNLLSQSIVEGAAEFITELVLGRPLQRNYITYGNQHKQDLKEAFKREMFSKAFRNWLYNGNNAKTVADLGYFIGYDICKSYYRNQVNKKQAIKNIIQLNYSDTISVENFLKQSKFYSEPINKKQIIQAYRAKQPKFIRIEEFKKNDTSVDASLKQITFVFSQQMSSNISISLGGKGKEFFPITGVAGFSDDRTKCYVNVALKPDHEYEFVITNRGFSSADGYTLFDNYSIKFKTRP